MARYFFLVMMLGGLALFMYVTKPSQTDYLERLQKRSAGMAVLEPSAFQHIRSADPSAPTSGWMAIRRSSKHHTSPRSTGPRHR